MKQPLIVRFLQRDGAPETWQYERVIILFVECMCLLAGVMAAPTNNAALLSVVTLPLALWATELARAERSGAARKSERAAAMAIPTVTLACEKQIVNAAKNKQIVTATAPIVALAMSVAGAGTGLTRAIVAGFVVSLIRYAMVELYGVWRGWYRSHVPLSIIVRNDKQAVQTPSQLAATSPYQSASLARLAEDILASKRDEDNERTSS